MKKFSILVTGVSAIPGYGVLNSLKISKYPCYTVGTGIYNDSVGKYWCDKFIKVPRAWEQNYIETVLDIIKKNNIDLIIPTVEEEIEQFIRHNKKFHQLNVKVALNNISNFDKLNNKGEMYHFLKEKVGDLIPTIIGNKNLKFDEVVKQMNLPFIMKKRLSSGSKGIVFIEEKKDFEYWSYKFNYDYICQRRIKGNEYTIAVFGTGDGKFVNMIVFDRKLKYGTTIKAKCIDPDDALIEYVKQICEVLKPEGPTNLQIFKEDITNKYLLIEINARISASTSIRSKMGYNEPEMCIEYYLLNKIPEQRIPQKGKALRYFEDIIELK